MKVGDKVKYSGRANYFVDRKEEGVVVGVYNSTTTDETYLTVRFGKWELTRPSFDFFETEKKTNEATKIKHIESVIADNILAETFGSMEQYREMLLQEVRR